ncbi:MAG: type II secretion system protein [Bdellovibrionales bacterium]|nr:type II secretion system protein [Bdellovibrionales bacterium]
MNVKSTRGMSLVEIIVAVGIFGIVSVVLSTAFVEMMKSQKNVENRDRANDFATSFGRMLYNDGTCSSLFCNPNGAGACQNTFILPAKGSPEELELKTNMPGINAPELKAGVEVDRGIAIRSLTIEDSGMAPQPVLVGTATYNKVNVRVTLVLDLLNMQNGAGAGTQAGAPNDGVVGTVAPRFYDLPMYIDPGTRQIIGCKVEMTTQDSCALLGAEVDPVTGLCKPQQQCMMFGHYITSVCDTPRTTSCPPPVPNAISRKLACPVGSIASQTGKFVNSWTESCGKKCSFRVTNTQEYFICLRCTQ